MKRFLPQIILLILIAIFFLSGKKTEKQFESALLNPKYSPDRIHLEYKDEGRAVFSKAGGFWICSYDSQKGESAVFPCDTVLVENLINYAKNIIKMYEISDSLRSKDRFSLSDSDAFCVEFFENGKSVSKIYFGAADSRNRIAFRTRNRRQIFATDSPVLNYLNLSPDFWCAPEIFPAAVCGALPDEKASKLRHGKIFLGQADFSLAETVEIDDGRANIYRALLAPSKDAEGNFFCRFEAVPSAVRSPSEKEALKSLDYVTLVSDWTFRRLKEQ